MRHYRHVCHAQSRNLKEIHGKREGWKRTLGHKRTSIFHVYRLPFAVQRVEDCFRVCQQREQDVSATITSPVKPNVNLFHILCKPTGLFIW